VSTLNKKDAFTLLTLLIITPDKSYQVSPKHKLINF